MKSILESNAKLRELIVEYRMLTDLALHAATKKKELQIARLEHDTFGYDVILKVDDTIKYVQLKARIYEGRCSHWDVHRTLINNPDGTVVLILIRYSGKSISLVYRTMDTTKRASIISQPPIIDRQDEKKCKVSLSDFKAGGNISSLYHNLFE